MSTNHRVLSAVLAASSVLGCSSSSMPALPPFNPATASWGRALKYVVRVETTSGMQLGSGWIHRSGRVITNAHVVKDAGPGDVRVRAPGSVLYRVRGLEKDFERDLALIVLEAPPSAGLELSTASTVEEGAQVAVWGYPGGYQDETPLLAVGYVSGLYLTTPEGLRLRQPQWVISAAFNLGNSGGPIFLATGGGVLGIVRAKLNPVPGAEAEIEALRRASVAQCIPCRNEAGEVIQKSAGEIAADILEVIRRANQPAIGFATGSAEIREFLASRGVDP
jgi:S1-C subfamily serine protease